MQYLPYTFIIISRIIFNYEGIPTAGETVFVGGLQVRILRTTRSRIDLARVRKL